MLDNKDYALLFLLMQSLIAFLNLINENVIFGRALPELDGKRSRNKDGSSKACDQSVTLTAFKPWHVITSPNYPETYPDDLNCTISVNAVDDKFLIELVFSDFLLEEPSDGKR